jgi:ankyrin repeat protein
LVSTKALIDKGAELEAKTPYGQTPLYLAAMNGHDAVVQLLLEKGAHTDVHDTFYKASLLDFVLERKHYGIAKMIIAKGTANPGEQLANVAESGQADLVQLVLEKNKLDQTALDNAYESALTDKQTAVAELLKKAGAHEPSAGVQLDPKLLASYAGTYKTDQFPLDIKISVREGKLYMQATGQSEFAPRPKSPTVFEFAPAHLEVDFDSPSSFTLKQGGRESKFTKAVTP